MAYKSTNLQRVVHVDSIVTVHYFEYMKDFVFAGESHNFWEILYVDKGSVFVTAGTEETLLHQGDLIVHEPNEFHALRSCNSAPNLVVFSFVCDSPILAEIRHKIYRITAYERELVGYLVRAARNCFLTPLHLPSVEKIELAPEHDGISEQLVLQYLEMLLLYLCHKDKPSQELNAKFPTARADHAVESAPHPASHSATHSTLMPATGSTKNSTFMDPVSSTKNSSLMNQIESYLQNHICERLSAGQIAEAFSLSPSSLQTLFRREKGSGAIRYFNDLKIDRACEIIRNDSMSLSEIAYYLSYSSPQYFSRCFREITGMTPSEYQTSVKQIALAISHTQSSIQRELEDGQ